MPHGLLAEIPIKNPLQINKTKHHDYCFLQSSISVLLKKLPF